MHDSFQFSGRTQPHKGRMTGRDPRTQPEPLFIHPDSQLPIHRCLHQLFVHALVHSWPEEGLFLAYSLLVLCAGQLWLSSSS